VFTPDARSCALGIPATDAIAAWASLVHLVGFSPEHLPAPGVTPRLHIPTDYLFTEGLLRSPCTAA
jgi:hypothetical protein